QAGVEIRPLYLIVVVAVGNVQCQPVIAGLQDHGNQAVRVGNTVAALVPDPDGCCKCDSNRCEWGGWLQCMLVPGDECSGGVACREVELGDQLPQKMAVGGGAQQHGVFQQAIELADGGAAVGGAGDHLRQHGVVKRA